MPAIVSSPSTVGWGPVYAARSRTYKVRPFVVYTPQPDPRYVGCIPTERFETLELAQARVAELLASNTYVQDAKGWWRLAS